MNTLFYFIHAVGLVTIGLHILILIFMMIPGEEPEKTLKQIVELLQKFSR